MFKRSVLSSAVAVVVALSVQTAVAQQEEADSSKFVEEELFVTGIRGSLTKALGIKRDKKQIIDVIVAEDIGKFPDNNVVEALQRVTGVQVTDRGAGEINGVTIRGLGNISTTINGRQIFTSAGRSIQLADIPASLLNRVDVYKTRSADKIEGGISGQIDVVTHRPFNFDASKFSVATRVIQQENSDETDPSISALISNRWSTDAGEFGALLNISHTTTSYRDQNVWAGIAFPYDNQGFNRISDAFYERGTLEGLPTAPGSTIDVNGTATEYSLVRDAVGFNDYTGTRKRPAANIALQWAPNDTSEYLVEIFYNGYRNEDYRSLVHIFADEENQFQNPEYFDGTNVVKRTFINNADLFSSGDGFISETDSYVYAIGGQWDIGSSFELESEVIYQVSEFERAFFAMQTAPTPRDRLVLDFNDGDGVPSIVFLDDPATPDVDEGSLARVEDWTAGRMFEDVGRDKGDSLVFTSDLNWTVENGLIETVSFGVRYEDRNASSYGGGSGSSGGCVANNTSDLSCNLSDYTGLVDTDRDDFFSGHGNVPREWVSANGGFLLDNSDLIRQAYNLSAPVQTQRFDITETTATAYLQADFGVYVADRLLDGQVGVRVSNRSSDFSFNSDETTSDTRGVNDTDVLPSLILRYGISDDLIARFSAGKTVLKPEFFSLNPELNVSREPDSDNEVIGAATSGNPDLESVTSTNFDLSLEWYFADSSSLYGVLFNREVDGFIFDAKQLIEVDGENYVVQRPANAGEGELNGIEIGFQYFPDNVPSWLQGFGVHASYTYIDGETNDPVFQVNEETGAEEVVELVTNPLVGVSDNSYSIVLAYEKDRFDMRLSYVSRDDFLRGYNKAGAQPAGFYSDSEASMNFQLSVNVAPEFVVTFDATNITEEVYNTYFSDETLFNADSALYSRTFALGARYSF